MPALEWIGKDKVVNTTSRCLIGCWSAGTAMMKLNKHTEDNSRKNMIIHGDNLKVLKALRLQCDFQGGVGTVGVG